MPRRSPSRGTNGARASLVLTSWGLGTVAVGCISVDADVAPPNHEGDTQRTVAREQTVPEGPLPTAPRTTTPPLKPVVDPRLAGARKRVLAWARAMEAADFEALVEISPKTDLRHPAARELLSLTDWIKIGPSTGALVMTSDGWPVTTFKCTMKFKGVQSLAVTTAVAIFPPGARDCFVTIGDREDQRPEDPALDRLRWWD